MSKHIYRIDKIKSSTMLNASIVRVDHKKSMRKCKCVNIFKVMFRWPMIRFYGTADVIYCFVYNLKI